MRDPQRIIISIIIEFSEFAIRQVKLKHLICVRRSLFSHEAGRHFLFGILEFIAHFIMTRQVFPIFLFYLEIVNRMRGRYQIPALTP